MGVCVREYSAEELKKRTGYTSFRQNVVEKANGCIHELYEQPHGEALYGTLSHTHLSVILRAISAGVKWEIPVDELTADCRLLVPLIDQRVFGPSSCACMPVVDR